MDAPEVEKEVETAAATLGPTLLEHLSSRKIVMTLITMILIVGVSCLSGVIPALGANLMTIVGGLLGALSLFITGHALADVQATKIATAGK